MDKTRRLVDWIVAKATWGMFTGDERDGEAPPITIQNFTLETQRYGAKALRARLSELSSAELLTEARAVRAHLKKKPGELSQIAERFKRNEDARAHRQRQGDLGRRHHLQPPILAAARHYRDQGMTTGEAWDAIRETPFKTVDGHTVEIEGDPSQRLKQKMRVRQADGQAKRAIGYAQWRQRYWVVAAQPR
jgi:hypothetical protein